MTDVSNKVEQALARFDRVTRALDERDGAPREAARRERQRLNGDLKRRAARIGIVLLVVSMVTILIGIVMPIGMFGFLAALTLAVGAAIALAFTPTRPAATAPSADLANGQMVQRFDSYLYRTRGVLPAPARAQIDAISAELPSLKQTLERIDTHDPKAQDARRLMSMHLPGLIDRYLNVPAGYRKEADGEGLTVDERLVDGLSAARTALCEISEDLARGDMAAFETQGRFIKSRYGAQTIDQ
ncbi:hypothetical protein H8M03_04725 [Sphingomonas sabuli]|uniref:Uncharacterized protein n=1 Tax=Sphingomonas sabuli TaxID=2764186 RepID=A0A7G9L4T4_9SPHN|nr:hypothetical protein [Sphingomonas sabuli]QNM83633.1 hypothetical protein H8M03_04725 [Sphingomonas sabuli]